MLRISDARMSGTSYGACVLHVSPESYVGGSLALLKSGDIVRLDLPNRSLDMLVDAVEPEHRRAEWKAQRISFWKRFRLARPSSVFTPALKKRTQKYEEWRAKTGR